MKIRIFLLLGVVTWHVTRSNAKAVSAKSSASALRTVTKRIGIFNDRLFKAVAEHEAGNLIFSPISVSIVLMMAAYGARGATEQQLHSVLGLKKCAVTKFGMQSLIDSFDNFQQVELRLANKIYLANNFQPKAKFIGITKDVFRSKAESLDFGKAAEASKTINDWCEATTNNHIKDFIKPDELGTNTNLVLVNAVYFQGGWKDPFDPRHTREYAFYVNNTMVTQVPTMYTVGNYRHSWLPNIGATFIELPYRSKNASDEISMFIILPNKREGLAEVENNLDGLTIDQLLSADEKAVSIWLPKFKIESTIDLRGPLSKLGLGDMFTDKANFTGIVNSPPLKITNAVHKAFIEVNEVGSVAAAASAVGITARILPEEMKIDHPFLYLIIMRSSKTVLFQGRVTNIP